MIRSILTAAAVPALVLLAQPAWAQQAKAPAAPAPATVSADPATTSASYGDWVLRCQRVGDADKARRLCEVAHVIQAPNQSSPIAEVALGHLPGDPALHITAVLPANVSFPSSVSFATADGKTKTTDMQWRRCLPGGCFADAAAPDENVKIWRTESATGRLTFKDALGRDVALPVSFRGLAQALDALAKS